MDPKKTVGYVDWSLLLLIGSALGLSKGIVNSGLADYVGGAIRDAGISADASLFVLYAFTMVSGLDPFVFFSQRFSWVGRSIHVLLESSFVGYVLFWSGGGEGVYLC